MLQQIRVRLADGLNGIKVASLGIRESEGAGGAEAGEEFVLDGFGCEEDGEGGLLEEDSVGEGYSAAVFDDGVGCGWGDEE